MSEIEQTLVSAKTDSTNVCCQIIASVSGITSVDCTSVRQQINSLGTKYPKNRWGGDQQVQVLKPVRESNVAMITISTLRLVWHCEAFWL